MYDKIFLQIPILLLAVLVLISGCTLADLEVNVASERTSLENQVLGTYNSLNQRALLVASVRGVTPGGEIESRADQSRAQDKAMESMQVLGFHRDDIQNFKTLGWVGENNQGLLTPFSMQKENIPANLHDFASRYAKQEFDSVVSEVNRARENVMQQVIRTNERFNPEDMDKIRKVFWKMHVQEALPGEKIQTRDGTWKNKQK